MSEGTRFKTGFLPARTSFTSLGMKLGEDIAESVQAIQNERLVKQHRLNTTMGFTKALDEAVPAGLTGKYNSGAQKLLDAYQEAATKAYRTGNQADVDEYQRLKNDFVEFKNISTAKSALDNQTRLSIAQGNYKNLSGTIEQNLAAYNDFASAEYRFNDVTRELEVNTEGGFVPWRTSNIGDLNDVFVPKTLWQGTEYMPENMGNAIYEDVLKARELTYQNRTDFGFADGTLNEASVYADIDANLQSKFAVRGSEMMEAIAVTGYKNLQKPGATQLTESDLSEAGVLYNEQEIFVDIPDVGNIGTGKLSSTGEWVFDVSDEQIQEGMTKMNMGAVARQYIERRKAIKLYMEESATKAFDRVQRDNQIAQDLAARRSDAAAEARLEAASAKDAPTTDLIPVKDRLTIPEFRDEENNLRKAEEVDVYRVPASVKGREFKFVVEGPELKPEEKAAGKEQAAQTVLVTNAVLDTKGNLVAYDIATGPGLIEGVQQDIAGLDLSTETVFTNDSRFDLINSKFRAVDQPTGRRIGRDILEEAQNRVILAEFKASQEGGQE